MSLNSSNVDIGKTGRVSFAPVGTTAPTDPDTALPGTWRDVGYISDDGVKETLERSQNNIVAWQNADVVRVVVTESSLSVAFTMIETNAESLALFYGTEVNSTDGSLVITPGDTGGRRAVVLDYVDATRLRRLYLPLAEVTDLGEITVNSSDPVGYEVTITAYPDSALGGSAKKWFSELAA